MMEAMDVKIIKSTKPTLEDIHLAAFGAPYDCRVEVFNCKRPADDARVLLFIYPTYNKEKLFLYNEIRAAVVRPYNKESVYVTLNKKFDKKTSDRLSTLQHCTKIFEKFKKDKVEAAKEEVKEKYVRKPRLGKAARLIEEAKQKLAMEIQSGTATGSKIEWPVKGKRVTVKVNLGSGVQETC